MTKNYLEYGEDDSKSKKTIDKYSESGEVYNGFIWKIVGKD